MAKAKKKKSPVVYVGPGFRDSELSTYKIFEEMPAAYAEHPIYKHLFVPTDKLDAARKEIAQTGSLRHIFYQKAVAEHEEKKGGK